VVRSLGCGKYSKVKLCQKNDDPECLVAIKVINTRKLKIRDSVSPLSKNSAKDINTEIEILELTDHQNIIRLMDLKSTETKQYIILDFCDEGCLQNFIEKEGPLSEN